MEPTAPTSPTGFFAWWRRTPLYLRIVGGMVLGVLLGMLLGAVDTPYFHGKQFADEMAIPSRMVLRLLGALAPPLILLAIVQALMRAKFTGKLLALLLLNTVIAILVGLFVANTIKPGRFAPPGMHSEAGTKGHGAEKPDLLEEFLDNVPKSALGPLTDQGKVMGVIFIAVAVGIAFRKVADHPITTLAELVRLLLETLVTILHWVVEVVPLAVLGLVASIVATKGFGAFHALGAFVLAVILALLLQAVYYLVRVKFGSWVSPIALVRHCRDALVMAFSTGSSTITMPVTYECLHRRVGLRERSASLGALVGANFNNDGTALYEAMAALFISQYLGIELSIGQQFLVVITSVVASVGAAGIPEAGLVTMTLVFTSVGLPTEYIALLLPVDWFLDRCRTAINVMGDMNVSCMLDGQTREMREEASALVLSN